MSQEPFLTSAGWSLSQLISRGPRFREIPRVSVSDQNLEVTIHQHETSGVPLVIEGMHEHETWPTSLFDIQWLRDNSKQQIQVRNVHNRQDLDVSFVDFLDHVQNIHHYSSVDETSRWYAKDLECPREWKKWLDATPLIPRLLCPHGPADIIQNLPERGRVETLMCYLGIGDTFTPCHKDLCASYGHNLMCHTENGGSAFWFMTDSSAASSMAKYFQSLGHELDLESHTMSIEEFSAAPCDVYITEQKVGDLVLVPPRSCHQVVNHGGLTVKMSWSRMSVRSAQVALRHELPIYRRVCRVETYRTKSIIHHTLRRNTALLEGEAKESGDASRNVFRKQLANDVQSLLGLFQEIIQDEYHPDAEILYHIIRDFNHKVYDTEGYPAFSCDFCGSDIFVSFFCCKECTLSDEKPSNLSDGLHICPGCYAEGRCCRCEGLMEPVQCWPLEILYTDYNRAVRALRSMGIEIFTEVGLCSRVLDNNVMGVFEAGTVIQKWGKERLANKARPRVTPNAVSLHCQKCHKGRSFVHLAELGVHSSEAIVLHKMSRDHGPFHNVHIARRKAFASDKEAILAAEVSGDSIAKLIGQKLAITALSYPHCQPLNVSHIKFGWYDRLKLDAMPEAVLGSSEGMDMSFPRDGGDWGSPLTDIGPEDSVSNTLVEQETPSPRDTEHAKAGLSTSARSQSSAAITIESTKRKRNPVVFDGVAPPERKRKMTVEHPELSPSAAHLSRPVTSAKSDERNQHEGPRFIQSMASLEGSLVQAISKIETLTTTIAEQNRKIEVLVQDNMDLRDEIRNLSQTLQSSKRDLQRVEYTIPKMTGELKVKFEKMLEKAESRIQGPIDRLLEEVGRMCANPPTPAPPPVHVPSDTTFPPNPPFAPEPSAGESDWTHRDDYIPPDLNKPHPHYHDNYEHHGPPNHRYHRGGFRPYRGRARGARGGYQGNRPPFQRSYFPSLPEGYGIVRVTATATPSTPTSATHEPTSTAMLPPAPIPPATSAATPRHGDAYDSQGHAPTPQQQQQHRHHTPSSHSHAYPHPDSNAGPSADPRPRPHPYHHAHTHASRMKTSPSESQIPSSSQPQRRWNASRPQTYERDQRTLPPRFHARAVDHRDRVHDDDERQGGQLPGRSERDHDDGYRDARYANAYTTYSPAHSEEALRWLTTPPSDGTGRRHSQSQSRSQSPGSGQSRGYPGHASADDLRGAVGR